MKVMIVVTALAAASGLWAAAMPAVQDSNGGETRGGLVRIAPERDDFDARAWRERLTSPDFDERERAFDEVVERARQVRGAEEALEEWSRAADELAWTARLALRELRRSGGALRPQTSRFRPDPFGGDFFGRDPFGGGGDPFESMREQMQRMLQEFHGVDPFDQLDLRGLPPGASSRSQSFQLRQTPEGVEVEITEDEGEGPVKRTYQAPSLEELYEAHPELRNRMGVRAFEGRGPLGGDLREFLRGVRPPTASDLEGARPDESRSEELRSGGLRRASERVERTDVLGVYLDPEAAEGVLAVEAVQPGTIAAALRLRPGDVLLELNGREVGTAEDIRHVLEVRLADEDVRALVRTSTGDEEELVWSPE